MNPALSSRKIFASGPLGRARAGNDAPDYAMVLRNLQARSTGIRANILSMVDTDGADSWYSVRCILRTPSDVGFAYEERLTLWRVGGHESAIALAESEAENYAADVSDETQRCEYVGLAQSYWLFDKPSHGAEVFSLIRESALDADEYLAHFFSTGSERQEDI